jgi:hypothetical protein
LKSLLVLSLVCVPAVAAANPKKLPFSYGTATMPEGGMEIEQYVDVIPLRVLRENDDGTLDAVWSTRYVLTQEFELGLTERVELGVYLQSRQSAELGAPFHFDGIKQRARFRISDPATWPIGLAGYLEVAELQGEVEIEEKLLASWRRGPLEVVGNLWVEQEYYFADEEWKHVYNPTLGATWELSPRATVGLEYWARGRFDADTTTSHYVGPTVMASRGEHWIAVGAYARVDASEIEVGDPDGRLFVRMILGIGL